MKDRTHILITRKVLAWLLTVVLVLFTWLAGLGVPLHTLDVRAAEAYTVTATASANGTISWSAFDVDYEASDSTVSQTIEAGTITSSVTPLSLELFIVVVMASSNPAFM